MKRRTQITTTLDPDVERALRDRAEATGLSIGRVVDAVARRALGLAEPPSPVPPRA